MRLSTHQLSCEFGLFRKDVVAGHIFFFELVKPPAGDFLSMEVTNGFQRRRMACVLPRYGGLPTVAYVTVDLSSRLPAGLLPGIPFHH